jgi:hypothetical protein
MRARTLPRRDHLESSAPDRALPSRITGRRAEFLAEPPGEGIATAPESQRTEAPPTGRQPAGKRAGTALLK